MGIDSRIILKVAARHAGEATKQAVSILGAKSRRTLFAIPADSDQRVDDAEALRAVPVFRPAAADILAAREAYARRAERDDAPMTAAMYRSGANDDGGDVTLTATACRIALGEE